MPNVLALLAYLMVFGLVMLAPRLYAYGPPNRSPSAFRRNSVRQRLR